MTICPIPQQKKEFLLQKNYRGFLLVPIWFIVKGGGGVWPGNALEILTLNPSWEGCFIQIRKINFAFYPRFFHQPWCIYQVYLLIAMFSFCLRKKLQENMHYIELGLKVQHPSIINLIYLSLYVIILLYLEYT